MISLTPLHHDALCEIFNIGVGHAASSMSQMVGEEVQLSVPDIRFVARHEAAGFLEQRSSPRLCAVIQEFSGRFSGEAWLMFPEENTLEVVRLMVGKSLSTSQLTELEQDALTEIGNIILNACISSLSEVFQRPFECSMPALNYGTPAQLFHSEEESASADEHLMFLHIQFSLIERSVEGYVAFVMNLPSLTALKESIDEFLGGILG